MYERFTDRARKLMQLANQEAQRCNHECIGTEHLLLGLVREGSGVACNVLRNMDIDLRKIRLETEKCMTTGPTMITVGNLPHNSEVKKVLEFAIEESKSLNHNYVGTEHILLGLLREQEGIASHILISLGVELEKALKEILAVLSWERAAKREVGPIAPTEQKPVAALLTSIDAGGCCSEIYNLPAIEQLQEWMANNRHLKQSVTIRLEWLWIDEDNKLYQVKFVPYEPEPESPQ